MSSPLAFHFPPKPKPSCDVSQEPEGEGLGPSSGAGENLSSGWLLGSCGLGRSVPGSESYREGQQLILLGAPSTVKSGRGTSQFHLVTHEHQDGVAQPLRSPSSQHLEGTAQTPAASHRPAFSSERI